MKNWNYVSAMDEEKVEAYPNSNLYRTLKGVSISSRDASDELVQKGIKAFEAFIEFCNNHNVRFNHDSEYGGLGFTIDKLTFQFDSIETNKIYILSAGGHLIGTIYRIQDEDA